jgi:hypothetical protein
MKDGLLGGEAVDRVLDAAGLVGLVSAKPVGLRHAIKAQVPEHLIEASVFHHHNDDVLDRLKPRHGAVASACRVIAQGLRWERPRLVVCSLTSPVA